ncbi:chromate transporter [Thermoanaerobacter thermocopriae]|nr:chromate transporter [Thermoanaerobacter thermocopriae]
MIKRDIIKKDVMTLKGKIKKLEPRELFLMFWAFFKIGAFTLGGGFTMIPLMKEEMVDKQKWIKEEEFLDIIAVTQSAPGAVAINTSIYIGYKLYGLVGSFIATLGTILPSFLIIVFIALFYDSFKSSIYVKKAFKGIYPGIVVLILASAFNLRKAAFKTPVGATIAAISLTALLIFDLHPIIVILTSGIAGMLLQDRLRDPEEREGK